MNGRGDGSRRPEARKPPKPQLELSGHLDVHHLGNDGGGDNSAVLTAIAALDKKLDALALKVGELGNDGAQAQINELVSQLKAATDAQAAVVAANQPKE